MEAKGSLFENVEYRNTYRNLLQEYSAAAMPSDRYGEFKSTSFWPIEGSLYARGHGLMVVGRAPNEWGDAWTPCQLMKQGVDGVLAQTIEQSEPKDRCPMLWADPPQYNMNRLAFWRVIRQIIQVQYPGPEDWRSWLCWSNLAKISPFAGGNPSTRMLGYQQGRCKELLKMELDWFLPAVLLVVALGSGFDWYVRELVSFLNISTKPFGGAFVKEIGSYDKTTIILTRRPDNRRIPEEGFVREVLRILRTSESSSRKMAVSCASLLVLVVTMLL